MTNKLLSSLFFTLLLLALNLPDSGFQPDNSLSSDNLTEPFQPQYEIGDIIYADIDSVNSRVYLLLNDGLWSYELEAEKWSFLDSLINLPENLNKFEFGYNAESERLLLWSRGVGLVYEINLTDYSIQRLDRSFPHMNQFGHQPFFHEGDIHAFGGYGLWEWRNITTFFNSGIKEWNIVSIHENSPMPGKRVPFAGVYLSTKQEMYIYGGESSEDQRPDFNNVVKTQENDIWRFSFENLTWEYISEINSKNTSFFRSELLSRIGPTNAISSSFYSPKSGYWYLPVFVKGSSEDIFRVKPVHLQRRKDYPVIELPLGRGKQFLVSNFLFNQPENNVVLVGVSYRTNATTLPVNVVQFSEDSLSAMINSSAAGGNLIYYLIAFSLLLLSILILKRNRAGNIKSNGQFLRRSELGSYKWLNDGERQMINELWDSNSFVDSLELEELIWPNIDNYDYRRKLRNETINSINKKFTSEFPKKGKLIVRKKDLNDNRRYLYGVNEIFLNDD